MYVRKRPFVDHFMEVVGRKFEVVVFTASLAKYADPLLDQLDITRTIRARLFRESCVPYEGNYVKVSRGKLCSGASCVLFSLCSAGFAN